VIQEGIAMVVDIIRQNQPWLQEVISLRDRISHFQKGGVPYEFFTVRKTIRGPKEVVLVPMWGDETVRDALGGVWRKLLCFCEAFIGFTLYLRLKPYWGVRYTHIEDEGETESDEAREDERWAFVLDFEALRHKESNE
jgi:hypothetical protein